MPNASISHMIKVSLPQEINPVQAVEKGTQKKKDSTSN